MRRIVSFLLASILLMSVNFSDVSAKTNEMRGAWVSTVYNMDWPSSGSKNNVGAQQQEFINILDKLQSLGINSVFLQVRPKADAIYKSNINPWSDVLTGTQGQDPGYDPLQFAIDEAHKRGMELHAWFNPYRVTTSGTDLNQLASNNAARQNPSWVVNDGKALYFDPGNPEVIQYIVNTVMEVVNNYNVDGIHFDDYFYKGNFNDDSSYSKYGNGMSKDEWRRNNVNTLVRDVYNNIKAVKSNVQFGISPFGIWKNKGTDAAGSNTSGKESFYSDYADSVTWIKNGWVDYIAPQLYWTMDNKAASYSVLTDWWANAVKGTNVDLYIGQGVYKQGQDTYKGENVAAEITEQINLNRKYDEIDGSIYFSTRDILGNGDLQQKLKTMYVDSIQRKTLIGIDRYETAAKISREGWSNGANTVIIVNGYANADGLTATPLAAAYDAPILLTDNGALGSYTKDEIKILSPSKVILVGGEGVIYNSVINEVKSINSGIEVSRIGGIDRYETSLLIAKALDELIDVSDAYVCYGYGEADALSVSAKAGSEKNPIILSDKNSLEPSTYEWLRSESLQNIYFIGGNGIIFDSLISQVNGITANDVSGNRIGGIDRFETNAEVIKRLYSAEVYNAVIATKGYELADALTGGPFAAKINSPVILLDYVLSNGQKNILSSKKSDTIYEFGGGISSEAVKQLINAIQ